MVGKLVCLCFYAVTVGFRNCSYSNELKHKCSFATPTYVTTSNLCWESFKNYVYLRVFKGVSLIETGFFESYTAADLNFNLLAISFKIKWVFCSFPIKRTIRKGFFFFIES